MNARRSVSTIGGILSSVGLVLAAPAWGQPVYRCGSSYGPQACEGGRALAADDPRTPEQRAQADSAAQRDAALADGLEETRRREEARIEKYQPYVPTAAAASRTAQRKGPEVFTARTPGERKKAGSGKKKRAAQAASAEKR